MNLAKTPTIILALTLGLIALGLTMVYSASANKASGQKRAYQKQHAPEAYERNEVYHEPYYLKRQAVSAALGLAIMLGLSAVDHHRLRRMAYPLLGAAFVLLCLVFPPSPIGCRVNGACRWIDLGPMRFQPSEAAKLVMVIFMARMLVDRQRVIDSFRRGVLPACIVTGVFCFIIVVEPDFGGAAILCAIVFAMWFIGGMRILHLAALACMVVPLGALGIVLSHYRAARFEGFMGLWQNGLSDNEHVSQSLLAVASGGWKGLGLGGSIQKYAFLPEAHTDFIFAVMAEELGFLRTIPVVLAFAILIALSWSVALRACDTFGGYLASGITLMVAISAVLNMMVVLGLAPPKGLALPFISYGGSSMLVNCAAIGILINVAKYNALSDQAIPFRRRP